MIGFNQLNIIKLISSFIITSSLISLSMIDFDTMEIPNEFHLIMIMGWLLTVTDPQEVPYMILHGVLISVPYFILALITGGMGLGDVKLMFVSGFMFGAYNSLIVSVISGVTGILYVVLKKIGKSTPFPFGPFISIGMYVVMNIVLVGVFKRL